MVLRLLAAVCVLGVSAVPPRPTTSTIKQPNGDVLTVRIYGDWFAHWSETEDGYSIIHDKGDKWWYYAVVGDDGTLVSSGERAGVSDPASNSALAPHAHPPQVRATSPAGHPWSAAASTPLKSWGTPDSPVILKNLAIPLRWANHPDRTLPTTDEKPRVLL